MMTTPPVLTPPWTVTPTGLRLAVRLTPNAKAPAMDGIAAGANGKPVLQLRVAAPPAEGAANAALLDYLAATLKLRKNAVTLASGEAGRFKLVDIAGKGPDIAAKLAAWLTETDKVTIQP